MPNQQSEETLHQFKNEGEKAPKINDANFNELVVKINRMGFTDTILVTKILKNNDGDIEKTVNELVKIQME